jgi:hypothetical protein
VRQKSQPHGRDALGRFVAGPNHPRSADLAILAARLLAFDLGSLVLLPKTIRIDGRYRRIDAHCSICKQEWTLYVDAILARKTTGCRCQRCVKYRDVRAVTLGRRYDAIVQRCERDTHVSSHNYKGRGIKVLFKSREHFIKWALCTFPDSDFNGLDFDRIDNDGHYEPANLRLVDRSTNLRNRKRRKN